MYRRSPSVHLQTQTQQIQYMGKCDTVLISHKDEVRCISLCYPVSGSTNTAICLTFSSHHLVAPLALSSNPHLPIITQLLPCTIIINNFTMPLSFFTQPPSSHNALQFLYTTPIFSQCPSVSLHNPHLLTMPLSFFTQPPSSHNAPSVSLHNPHLFSMPIISLTPPPPSNNALQLPSLILFLCKGGHPIQETVYFTQCQ